MRRWNILEHYINKNQWTAGAEIGVWMGRTYQHLIEKCPSLKVMVGVDAYKPNVNPTGEQYTPGENGLKWEHDVYRERMEIFIKKHPGLAKFYFTTSLVASKKLPDDSLDFVFIDAGHDYISVKEDILLWAPKVKVGGMIFGHDFCDDFPGVEQAVRELFGDKGYELADDSVWIVKK